MSYFNVIMVSSRGRNWFRRLPKGICSKWTERPRVWNWISTRWLLFFPAPITATQRYRQPTVTVPRETLHRSANDEAKEATNVCPRKQLISAHHVGIDPVIQTWNTIIEKEEDNVDWLDFSQRDCRVLFVCSASF